ncbi:DUF3560 domain-containing protein [Pantoea ananatis]|uniref:DUF3560 domain-containing protein n=1 Tax=Pantoea ananas TaxID=553 RepID=UPI000B7E627F|nr:DUF3560 domain-containing protein [Pantoea ananatis]
MSDKYSSSFNLDSLPLETLLEGFNAKIYSYPESMTGKFAVRNSTDFQNAKIYAEVSSGHRVQIAEVNCNSRAQDALKLLTEAFQPLREALEQQKAARQADREHLNHYERRQEERRDRYNDLAFKKRQAALNAFDASHNAVAHIPFGQPILIGHHSERRHRAVLSRSHRLMDKSCELSKTADYYENRADSVGRAGISSDDPEAARKLAEKVTSLKKSHAMMIEANKIVRLKNVSDEGKQEALFCLGYSDAMIKEILEPVYGGQGFARYQLSLSNKAIKTAEDRILAIEKAKTLSTEELSYNGFTVQNDTDDNRIVIRFESKPAEDVRKLLKRNAFNYSPSRKGAWVRKITPNALASMKYLLKNLSEIM